MIYAFGSHPVKDFDTWKVVFDSDQPRADAAGVHCIKLLRSAEDANSVHFLFSAPNKEVFDAFFHNPTLGELMQQAGVLAPPTFQFFNEG